MANNRKPFEISGNRTDKAVDETETSFIDIPSPVVTHIGSFLEKNKDKDKATFSRLCLTTHRFYQPEFDKQSAKKLLKHVLQGKKSEALKMIEANPKLLFIRATAEDYAKDLDDHRRIIQGWSPLEAMFGTGDIDMQKAVLTTQLGWWNQAYVDQVPNGRELAAAQLHEKFPNGFDYPPSTYDYSPVVKAITNDQTLIQTGRLSPETEETLAKFRKDFMPGVVKQGFHFNLNDLIKACEVYNENYRLWNDNQESLFWRKVIGFLERLVTAFDAQVISQGITDFVKWKQALRRGDDSFDFHNYVTNKKISYFPLDSDPLCRLGLGFGVDGYYGLGWWRMVSEPKHFETLCRAKARGCEEFMQQLRQHQDSCVLGLGRKLQSFL